MVEELDATAFQPHDSPEDYILGSTDRIWLDRGVGLIESTYYAPDVLIHGALGTEKGVRGVVEGTVMSIASYPDELAGGEDVVWERRGTDAFISSHRVYIRATNEGWTQYGPPTNRPTAKRALAHCLVRQGRIVEEWVVRDEYSLVRDLGLNPEETARNLAGSMSPSALELGELPSNVGRETLSGVRVGSSEVTDLMVDLTDIVWNQRRFDELGKFVHEDVVLHTTRGRWRNGTRDYSTDLISLLAAFPDAQLSLLDLCVHDDPVKGRRAATMWVLDGTYSGSPMYGPTTNQPMRILGSSQYRLGSDGRIVEEFRVFDEMAIMIEIERHRLGTSTIENGSPADHE
ncbi:ester cyclase [Paenarthrobacter sp. OM7]|uniref:Ester cyclase n=1 Tax=Paenarthrobacter sp. AMU7 TaxID=3162492 RepID=A0AB39YNP7_9MICC|nr:ester cyclase [Paenarthrobacter sp. OM7]WGM20489.1 ester cyclase [Paenarthrobacter sp. OM7]